MSRCSSRLIAGFLVFSACALVPRYSSAQELSSIALSVKAAVARASAQAPQVQPMPMPARRDFHTISPTMQSLYFATAMIQSLDARSTFKALDLGAVETNPIVKPFASNRPVFIALKAGMTAAFIYQGHQMSKRHKIGAIIVLGLVNSIYTAIAVNNYHAIHVMEAQR